MKDWHKLKHKLFKIQPYYRPGCDISGISDLQVKGHVNLARATNAHRETILGQKFRASQET